MTRYESMLHCAVTTRPALDRRAAFHAALKTAETAARAASRADIADLLHYLHAAETACNWLFPGEDAPDRIDIATAELVGLAETITEDLRAEAAEMRAYQGVPR
jgi:hypothetical protein